MASVGRKLLGVSALVAALLLLPEPALAAGPGVSGADEPTTVTVLDDAGLDPSKPISEDELLATATEAGLKAAVQLDGQSATVSKQSTASAAVAYAAWDVVNHWNDSAGVAVYLRYGNGTTWGWVKVRDKHGVTQNMIKKMTQYPRTREKQGTAWIYETPAIHYNCILVICTADKSITVHAVNETGNNQGIITTCCLGLDVCPKWVRDAAA